MKVTRNDFLELAVSNVFKQSGQAGISYRAGITQAMEDLKLNNAKARELFEKGECEIEF